MAFNTSPPPDYLEDDADLMQRPPGPLTLADLAGQSDGSQGLGPLTLADLAGQSNSGPLPAPPPGPPVPAKAPDPNALPSAPPPPSFAPDGGYQSAMSNLEQLYGQRPQLPEPKWWQRVLGGTAGALAGWSNAGGRTRTPIDIGAMQQNILAPGYGQKLAEWQSRVQPAQAVADIEGQKQQAWWHNQQAQAQAQYLKAHADYMEGLGRGAYIDVTPEMEAQTGGIFKVGQKIPGTTATEIARISAGKYEKPEKTMTVTDPAFADHLHVPVGSSVGESVYAAGLKPDPSDRPLIIPPGATYFDPNTNKPIYTSQRQFAPQGDNSPAPANPRLFAQIENRKNTRLLQAEGAARTRIAKGDDPDQVSADLASTKQQVQNDFEGEVNAAGGTAQHFDYSGPAPAKGTPTPANASNPTPTPPKPAAAPPAGKRISVKLPDGRFMSGTEDQFRKAGIRLTNQ